MPVGGAQGRWPVQALEALFQPDSLQNKRNTEAVEIAPVPWLRVYDLSTSHDLPLDKARDQVRALYVAENSAELARKEGRPSWPRGRQPRQCDGLSAPVTVSRDRTQDQPRAVVDAPCTRRLDKLPAWRGSGRAGLCRDQGQPHRGPRRRTTPWRAGAQQYLQAWGSAEAQAYYELLKQRFKVQIKAPRPIGQIEPQN
jgi:peptidyl-prolyl cis-trans isomerase D